MKRTSFILVFAALVLSFGLAQGQHGGFTLDNVVGDFSLGGPVVVGDTVQTGVNVVFNIRWTNNTGANITGASNGFRVYSTDGADWDSTRHVPYWDLVNCFCIVTVWPNWDAFPYMNNSMDINPYSFTGTDADTLGFAGTSKFPSSGIADGFSEIVYQMTIGPFPEADDGKTVCLDSTYYPPANEWLWSSDTADPNDQNSTGDVLPEWDGPHCFDIYFVPNQPPVMDACDPLGSFDHCALATANFSATDDENDDITWGLVGPGVLVGNNTTASWSYQPTLADVGTSQQIVVTPSDPFKAGQSCRLDLNFTNNAPECVSGGNVVKAGGETATGQVTGTDADACDGDPSYFLASVSNGPVGNVSVDANTGEITFDTDVLDSGKDFDVCVGVTDGADTVECCVLFTISVGAPNKVCIETGTQADEAYQGQHYYVDVTLEKSAGALGGFNFLIAYDNSALSFQSALMGDAIGPNGCAWEYFTYRYGADGNCSGGCPSGLLRVVAIAETNNGDNHPVPDCLIADGSVLFTLDFLVSNDRTLECQFVPIRFFWLACDDNSLSSQDGNDLIIGSAVFDAQWPDVNIADDNVGYPTYLGPQNSDCWGTNEDKNPLAEMDLCNGGIHIACADSIDARGDVNLNEIGYEIADAVLFSNYFVYGISVFTTNMPGQVAATDVNADGIALSVADLVYLIRVVVGDALPYAKVNPIQASYTVSANGTLNVDAQMGAAYVLAEGNVVPTLLADNMDLRYNYDGQNTRILVYSLEAESFSGAFLTVNGNVLSVEMASEDGATVAAKIELPTAYSLNQNYPNPFNPSTNIGFALPFASNWTLTVYNVTGQQVASFSGANEAGNHSVEWMANSEASGIYFYKLDAGDNFTETKKMVLLK